MNIIRQLSPEEAQKVAAGEVVERPANIVKELLENALDAAATTITLYVEKAGKELIRVVDNGCGMSVADARSCFLPHATSKISKIEDLATIHSFGFRGEALASIAAVSKVTLITKLSDDTLGVQLECSQGIITHEQKVACSPGADFAVKELFYNIPARKKFLKQDETEWHQIQNLFYAFCLSNHSVHFKLFHDNKLVLNAPPVATIKDRVSQLWDYHIAQSLLDLQLLAGETWFSGEGLISNHHFWRYGKTHLFLFVNGRWIKDQEISKALLKGYTNVLPVGKFPAAFLFFTVDARHVDINVHPKKEEVRFIKAGVIKTALQDAVRKTLEAEVSRRLGKTEQSAEVTKPLMTEYSKNVERSILPFHQAPPPQPLVYAKKPLFTVESFQNMAREQLLPEALAPVDNQPAQDKKHEQTVMDTSSSKIIGQLFSTYIVVEQDEEVIIIDQHAAHERILYEKFKQQFDKKDGTALLFPEVMKLADHELQIVLREKEFFASQGIELELFGKHEIAITSAPPRIQNQSLKELVFEMIAFIQEHESLDRETFRKKLHEHMHSHMACKAAVKAGDELTLEQMRQLLDDLHKTEHRFICAHGRPTTWTLSQHQLEKHFRRC